MNCVCKALNHRHSEGLKLLFFFVCKCEITKRTKLNHCFYNRASGTPGKHDTDGWGPATVVHAIRPHMRVSFGTKIYSL